MKYKTITLLICIGLITIGVSSAAANNMNMNIARSLTKINMITQQEDKGVLTGGVLESDSYEIEFLDGNYFKIKKIQRILENNKPGIFKLVYIKNMDIKITYNKEIEDPENASETFGTFIYEKSSMTFKNQTEIKNKPHTVIIEGLSGWFIKIGFGSINVDSETNDFFFLGDYENLEIIEH